MAPRTSKHFCPCRGDTAAEVKTKTSEEKVWQTKRERHPPQAKILNRLDCIQVYCRSYFSTHFLLVFPEGRGELITPRTWRTAKHITHLSTLPAGADRGMHQPSYNVIVQLQRHCHTHTLVRTSGMYRYVTSCQHLFYRKNPENSKSKYLHHSEAHSSDPL